MAPLLRIIAQVVLAEPRAQSKTRGRPIKWEGQRGRLPLPNLNKGAYYISAKASSFVEKPTTLTYFEVRLLNSPKIATLRQNQHA